MTVKELVELLKDRPQDREVILEVEEYWRPRMSYPTRGLSFLQIKRVEAFHSPSGGMLVSLSDEGDQ